MDQDGICDIEELTGPNNGDSNSDGILDSEQAYVASVSNIVDGGYVTLITDSAYTFANMRAVTNPSPGNAPAGVNFPVGFFQYAIEGVPTGGSATVTMLLPPGVTVNTFYKYGSTGWYQFLYQVATATGAEIFDDDNDGDTDRIVLHFVDGSRGDDDLAANGRIVEPGAPASAVNRPPAASDDPDYTVDEDTILNVPAPGVLGNDTDPDGDPLSAVLVLVPSSGTFTLNADGSFATHRTQTSRGGQLYV
jgi:hypothetical protein